MTRKHSRIVRKHWNLLDGGTFNVLGVPLHWLDVLRALLAAALCHFGEAIANKCPAIAKTRVLLSQLLRLQRRCWPLQSAYVTVSNSMLLCYGNVEEHWPLPVHMPRNSHGLRNPGIFCRCCIDQPARLVRADASRSVPERRPQPS
jgi:hypothetical protein